MTLLSILENIIANLVSITVLGMTAYLLIYIRMAGFSRIVRRFIHPRKRVFALHQVNITQVVKKSQTQFVLPISEQEREILTKFFALRTNVKLFNGVAIRLDSLTDQDNGQVTASISKVGFFDFIATNLAAYPANESVRSLRKQMIAIFRSLSTFTIIQQVTGEVQKNGRITNVMDVLDNRSLANIVAVSVLIIDSNGRAGIVKRTKQVAVSSGNYGSTCAGTVGAKDFSAQDPFVFCAIREIQEELNLQVANLQFDGIVVPKQKMQPIFLYHVHMEKTWEELFPLIQQARDLSFETQAFYAVPLKRLIFFASHVHMTDTAAYQIWHFVKQNGFRQSWYTSLLRPTRLGKYLLPWYGGHDQSGSVPVKRPGSKDITG